MPAEGQRSLYDELEKPTVDRRIRQLPRLLWDAVGIVYRSGGRTFKLALVLQLLASASVLVQLLVVRSLLTRLIADRSAVSVGDIVAPLVVLVICLGLTAASSVARTAQQELLADLVSRETLYRVLQRAGRIDLLEFETSRLHDRLQRAIFNGTFRPLQMTSGLLAVLSGAGGSVGIGIALLAISPVFFLLAIASAVPVWLLGVVSSRVMYRFAYEQTRRDRDRLYLQDLQSERREAKELRAYDLNEHLLGLWRVNYDRRIADLRRVVRGRVRSGVLASFLSAVLLAVAIAVLVELVRTGHLSLGAAGAALGGLIVLGSQLQTLGAGIGAVYESALFVQDYTQFVTAPPDPAERTGFAGTEPAPAFAALAARGLGFSYPGAPRAALTGVDIDVAAGEVVALVGENGSGKSTLTKLLAGLYPAGTGVVQWNGVDYAGLEIDSVRDQIAVLFQDFVRFELTVADNVRFGRWRREADDAALHRVADTAGAGAAVAGLPDGWATRMGPEYAGGRELSGGQWQRLAIARALFRDAALVILDEPTAALDPRAEAALFRDVRTLFAGRSVVLVSHRFGSVRTADRIYVLHEGAVVEVGTHDELVAADGRYAEMYRLQRTTLLGD